MKALHKDQDFYSIYEEVSEKVVFSFLRRVDGNGVRNILVIMPCGATESFRFSSTSIQEEVVEICRWILELSHSSSYMHVTWKTIQMQARAEAGSTFSLVGGLKIRSI